MQGNQPQEGGVVDSILNEDVLLAQRIAAGEREALEDLYVRHRLALFGYLLGLAPDRGTAEEILQDTLLAVWRSAHTYTGPASLQAWLFGVARRQAHNTLRGRRPLLADATVLASLPTSEPGPEATALAWATRQELAAGIRRLTPEHQQALLLVLVAKLSYEQAAREIGVPIGTIRSRLSSARRALQRILRAAEEVDR